MSVTLNPKNASFVRRGTFLTCVLTVAYLVARSANEALVASLMGSGGDCVWRETGVWCQAVGFVLVRMAGIWLQLL
jgi:hypothetical protein